MANLYRVQPQIFTQGPEHKLAKEYGTELGNVQMVGVGEPDFDEIDRDLGFTEPDEQPEPGVSMSDVGAALSLIIEFICKGDGAIGIAARAETLHTYLDPQNSRYSCMADVAKAYGVTRAALSARLIEFRDSTGVRLTIGKRAFARNSYRKAQLSAVAAGVHASETRHDRNPNSTWRSRKTKPAEEATSLEAVAD